MKREAISFEEQLARWVSGDSVHRLHDSGENCTPDFSCCKPELQAERMVREAFAAAGESERMQFLGHFLGAAFASARFPVHITTDTKPGGHT